MSASQTRPVYKTLADHVIDNSGELPGLYAQIDALLAALNIEG